MNRPTRSREGHGHAVEIVSIYPVLLGTYGDGGNVLVLRHRARLHGVRVHVTELDPGSPVPRLADIYILGGGEDTAQVAAARHLRADGGLRAAADRGAAILAVCAGYQLLGESFPDADGQPAEGVGILDIRTDRLPRRAVGEMVCRPDNPAAPAVTDLITGYENHAGATELGPTASPLGRTMHGVGNGGGTEGAVQGRVIGTYAHGPALARNPQLADQLLSWGVGRELEPIEEPEVTELRRERLTAVLGARHADN